MIKRNIKDIVSLIIATLVLCVFVSCGSEKNEVANWDLTEEQQDSVHFSKYHHYNVGTNFVVVKDSLDLRPIPEGWPMTIDFMLDSAVIVEGEDFVITEIFMPDTNDSLYADSVWVRVGTDGKPLGWVPETSMLERSIPVGPIARSIYWFSTYHLYWFLVVVVVAGALVLYRKKRNKSLGLIFNIHKMDSFYPTAFCVSIATAAMLYATIQTFMPDNWVEFSYHYNLNPIGQPFLISLFLVFTWLSVILLLSVVYDLWRVLSAIDFLSFMFGLLSWGGVIYIVTTTTAEYYIGYAIYICYVSFALYQYMRHKGIVRKNNK